MSVPLLSLKKIGLKNPSKEQPILDEVSLDVFPGDFIILLGSNGSGKSSLIKIINGLSQPTAGELLFKGRALLSDSISHRAKEIVTLTQDLNLSTFSQLTVLENCLMAIHRNRRIGFSVSIKAVLLRIIAHLQKYNPKLCDKLYEPVSILSGGERQTLAFAMSLWNIPNLFLLDEHTSALDSPMAQKLMHLTNQLVNVKKITTIIATHHLDDALQYGNRLIMMNKGRIALDLNLSDKKKLNRETLLALYNTG